MEGVGNFRNKVLGDLAHVTVVSSMRHTCQKNKAISDRSMLVHVMHVIDQIMNMRLTNDKLWTIGNNQCRGKLRYQLRCESVVQISMPAWVLHAHKI